MDQFEQNRHDVINEMKDIFVCNGRLRFKHDRHYKSRNNKMD